MVFLNVSISVWIHISTITQKRKVVESSQFDGKSNFLGGNGLDFFGEDHIPTLGIININVYMRRMELR